jgi:hypothetical protein
MVEQISSHPQVAIWLAHVRALAVDIGPRGSTRDGERKGAEYARAQFEKMGLKPIWESFKSARSIFQPHLLGSLLMLLAFAIFPLGGRLTAVVSAALSILVLVSELLELGMQDNLFRRLVPKGESQNVYTVIPPSAQHEQDLILVGHLDSQRTPLIFLSPAWVKAYDRFTMITFITFILQAVLYTLAIFFTWSWIWYATIPAAICAILLAAMCIQADSTPFTDGANDNATGAGIVLTLAEHFARNPLQHTRIFAVCSGCEEVQHYGMIDFYKRHRAEFKDPKSLVMEMLGVAGPAWLTREGIIVPFKADPALLKTVEQVSGAHPEWGAYPAFISGGNTEMADAVRAKIPALTFLGVTPKRVMPYWHQKQDTFDKLDSSVMEKTWGLMNTVIQELEK